MKSFLSCVSAILLTTSIGFSASLSAAANTSNEGIFTAESGDERVQIIELFSSEGCHSCPPADKWLSQYTTHPKLWEQYVPLAFHVDYWDFIGWKDRFAKQRFSRRQYQYERKGQTRQVYTPQFVVNGAEWNGWFYHRTQDGVTLPEIADNPGNLSLRIEGEKVSASFDNKGERDHTYLLHVALLASDISSHITRGENKSKTLEHDFVVLNHKSYRAINKSLDYQGRLPKVPSISEEAGKLAWAAWIERNGVPIQATGGWINSP